jgi:hypothetical protein
MIKRTFATACHRLPTIPYLLERGSIFGLRKEKERVKSRELERLQNSIQKLTDRGVSLLR